MEISFLLGAGFSVLDNLPMRKEINARLRKISHSEIYIHTDGTALFLNGKEDPNADWMMFTERNFIERLIEYYCSNIIKSIEDFDYEYFFDFYQGFIKGKYVCWRFDEFAESFRSQFNITTDNQNLLMEFHNTFNQLIANLLSRSPKKTHLAKPYSKYPHFLNYIDEIKDSYKLIHFHTTNHDLLLEELAYSDALEGRLSDGFEESGSPYFSKNDDDLTVRLRRFTNNFDNKFRLYKLHGSLDNYVFNFKNKNFEEVKIPYGVRIDELMKEYVDENGKTEYFKCFWNYYPDFLSGAYDKVDRYNESCYYKPTFDHFITNLRNSDILITIGYGFGDFKINEIIKDNFLNESSKRMIVISPKELQVNILETQNVRYYGQNLGVQNISKDRIDLLLQ
jgi:hypothetical protein